MEKLDVLDFLDLNRAKAVNSDGAKLSESEFMVLTEIKEKDFGVDLVYFNEDENTQSSFPAVFIKEVRDFGDVETLKSIAETQRKIWNYKKVLFLYVYSEAEIRIYNCSERPLIQKENLDYEKELQEVEIKGYRFSDTNQLEELNRLFSRIAIDSGIVWTLEEAKFIRDKINLQRRVDKYLVKSLVNTANQLHEQGLAIEFIHKIILRSLFLLYLEDRGATDEKLYGQIKKGAESYFDILNNVEATYQLYERLEEDFNGNIFTLEEDEEITKEQLQLIKICFISGNDNTLQAQLFEEWRLFDFSIIQIELLSEIYENFLFETDPDLKKKTGTYYTPPTLVEFILNEKLPIHKTDKNYNVKVLDPSCGSGIFLVQSFKRLVKRYENQHKKKLTDFDRLKKLLTDNIFGIELHPQAIKVAAFSLYLALVDCLDPKTLWQKKKHRLPYLINNPNDKSLKGQGENLYCRDTIEQNKEVESIKFDLVVGNPPFGTRSLLTSVRNYCDKYDFAKEMVLPFLHKATTFAPNGEIALIFNTKVLTNTRRTYQNFRKWLFNDCYVEKVFNFSILRNAKKNFGGQLFGGATGPISVVFYQKEQPKNPSDTIAYYAPKTYIKTNVIDGLSIDSTDLKYLPREECQKPDTKIWKIAMWGGMNDWKLIEKLDSLKLNTVKNFIENNNIKSGVGFQLLTQTKDKPKFNKVLTDLKYLDAHVITRYYTPYKLLRNLKKSIKTHKATSFYKDYYKVEDINEIEKLTAFRRLGDIEAYIKPHIIVKKGLEQNRICASYIESKCSFRDGVYGFYTNEDNIEELYILLSYFNSNLSTYFLFMTISSYGIEREQIMKNEYLSIPINLNDEQSVKIKKATKEILSRLQSKSFLNNSFEKENLEGFITQNIDATISESLNLAVNEINLINDNIDYQIDLFHKQENSIALYSVLENQTIEYAGIITSELNDFLDGQGVFVNATIYDISRFSPLMMVKLSHEKVKNGISNSNEYIDDALKKLDQHLWEQKATNIYFRKKLNFTIGNNTYIIRPNQRRFWSKSMALEDASELILETLNGIHDKA